MRFLSVCSGIEAASVAWAPLGWKAAAFSEIEPFPSAVLAHQYPSVPNLGDMTKFQEWPDIGSIDLLCGGTPCQSFSVAGLRKGLADPRGNLMLTFGAIAAKHRPRWLVWENVPGVLSSNRGRDFGAFLGLLGELGYGFAYRVLDAQYAGLAQRRKRVFVVGCLGDWRRAAAVLFERHSLQGHPAPSRQARQGTAAGPVACLDGSFGRLQGASGQDANHGHSHLIAFGGNDTRGPIEVATARNACASASASGRMDFESETFLVAHALTGEGFDASEDGTGRGTPLVPIAFSAKDYGADAQTDLSPTLRAGGHAGSHANAGVMPAIAFDARQSDVIQYGEKTGPLDTCGFTMGIFADTYKGTLTGDVATTLSTAGGAGATGPSLLTSMQVRRLTPRECERLQGFEDDYTLIPLRNAKGLTNGKWAKDGPRYKALGNSWAVPCARWIGERIAAVDAIELKAAA